MKLKLTLSASLIIVSIISSQLLAQSVGIGITTPSSSYKLHVVASGINSAVRALLGTEPAVAIATPGAIYGESSTAIGIIGVSGTQNGVYGTSSGTLGGTVGVSTGFGKGIWGVATTTGTAGYFDGGSSGYGLVVIRGSSGFGTETPTGRLMVMQPATPIPALDTFAAITAYSYTSQGCLKGAVYGNYNISNYGAGVQGVGYNGINNQNAIEVFALGNQDMGVYGSANTVGVEGTSVGGIGVAGYNKNPSSAAVTGGGNTYGVYGYSNTIGGATPPTTRYGVYGYATGATTNIAGYFSGNVQISGSISKGSGTFKIDHPLDPANKYLYHSFVESPDMMNVYNGNAKTDATGKAIVELPTYFEAENKDFKYQLTIIDATQFAQARIGQKISGNKFIILTDKPGIEVSWQVTGVRQDKFANAHRVVPEVEKGKEEKGLYLHPAEWGQPEEKGIDFNNRPKSTGPKKQETIIVKDIKQTKEEKTKTIGGVEIK